MAKPNSKQVIRILKDLGDGLVAEPYFGEPRITDESFEYRQDFGKRVLQNLKDKGLLRFVGESNEFWETKYYKCVG